jgi:hypothetical protein
MYIYISVRSSLSESLSLSCQQSTIWALDLGGAPGRGPTEFPLMLAVARERHRIHIGIFK